MRRSTLVVLIGLHCAAAAGQALAFEAFGIAGGSWTVPVRTLKEIKFTGVVRQQYDFSCGSAAVATLLSYHYRDSVSEADVFAAMFENGDQAKIRRDGFSLLDIKRYLEQRGYRADGVEAELEQLHGVGIPAIVLIKENGYSHFVVIKGISADRVLVGDPALGLRVYEREVFETLWSNRILFVVRDRQEIAKRHFNMRSEWAARPALPFSEAIARTSLSAGALMRPGRGDF